MPKEELKDEKAKEETKEKTAEEIKKEQEEVKEKVEELKEAKKTASSIKTPKENIIGDISKPDVRDPDFDIKSWSKTIDEKIDRLLASQPKPAEPEIKKDEVKPEPIKKKSFWDTELF